METEHRAKMAVFFREQGRTFREIGEILRSSGNTLSAQGAREVFRRGRKILELERDWFYGIDIRIINAVKNAGVETKQQAIEGLLDGSIRVGKTKNLGRKSFAKLLKGLKCKKLDNGTVILESFSELKTDDFSYLPKEIEKRNSGCQHT